MKLSGTISRSTSIRVHLCNQWFRSLDHVNLDQGGAFSAVRPGCVDGVAAGRQRDHEGGILAVFDQGERAQLSGDLTGMIGIRVITPVVVGQDRLLAPKTRSVSDPQGHRAG